MPIILPPAGRDTLVTLTQHAFRNNPDSPVPDIVNENIKHCPEAALFEAGTIPGTNYPALVRTGYPTAHFRKYNQGVEPSGATYRTVQIQTGIVTTRVEVDKAYADSYPKGGAPAWQTIKSSEQMEAILRLFGAQVYYGLANDGDGFPGFWELVDPSMMIDLAGGVQGDGFRSSIWAVKTGVLDVGIVLGNNMTMDYTGEWRVETITPDYTQPSKRIDGYINQWGGFPGMQCLSKNSIAGIKNVTSDPGAKITMGMLRNLLESFPVGVVPDYIMMTRATRAKLRDSLKTALITDPPTPTDCDDVPIVVTDSISNAELAAYN